MKKAGRALLLIIALQVIAGCSDDSAEGKNSPVPKNVTIEIPEGL